MQQIPGTTPMPAARPKPYYLTLNWQDRKLSISLQENKPIDCLYCASVEPELVSAQNAVKEGLEVFGPLFNQLEDSIVICKPQDLIEKMIVVDMQDNDLIRNYERVENKEVDFLILHSIYPSWLPINSPEALTKTLQILLLPRNVSAHYLVTPKGAVIQLVDEKNRMAFHAGESAWGEYNYLNTNSVGIEFQTATPISGDQYFPEAQVRAGCILARHLCDNYNITPDKVLSHADIAVARPANPRVDPGPNFFWQQLLEAGVGNVPDLRSWITDKQLDLSEANKAQEILSSIGYNINLTGEWDQVSKASLKAFKDHYGSCLLDPDAKLAIKWPPLQDL